MNRDRGIPPSDLLRPETTQFQCPECGKGCFLGIRADGGVVFTCHEHGSFYDVDGKGRVGEGARPPATASREDRGRLLELACRVFLSNISDAAFMIAQSVTLPCNYVMLRVLGGRIRAEICSRDWGCEHCGDRPPSARAQMDLATMGFKIPGPRENMEQWVELPTRENLADLLDRCLIVAYDDPPDADVIVYLARSADVGSLVESLAVAGRAAATPPAADDEVVEATFLCSLCQEPAATVTYLPRNVPHPGPWPADAPPGVGTLFEDSPRLVVRGGPSPVTLGADPRVADAVRTGDAAALFQVNGECAPFWCPRCGSSYCASH